MHMSGACLESLKFPGFPLKLKMGLSVVIGLKGPSINVKLTWNLNYNIATKSSISSYAWICSNSMTFRKPKIYYWKQLYMKPWTYVTVVTLKLYQRLDASSPEPCTYKTHYPCGNHLAKLPDTFLSVQDLFYWTLIILMLQYIAAQLRSYSFLLLAWE